MLWTDVSPTSLTTSPAGSGDWLSLRIGAAMHVELASLPKGQNQNRNQDTVLIPFREITLEATGSEMTAR